MGNIAFTLEVPLHDTNGNNSNTLEPRLYDFRGGHAKTAYNPKTMITGAVLHDGRSVCLSKVLQSKLNLKKSLGSRNRFDISGISLYLVMGRLWRLH